MKIAITGGTGFVGGHLARRLLGEGHEAVLIARGLDNRDIGIRELFKSSFFPIGMSDEEELVRAFDRCDGVAHCAGINRESGEQTYRRVHIEGTRNVVNAAKRAGVKKVAILSFLRARPGCGSPYHESKWAAEEIVRSSGLDYTVLKAGVIYGKGDHMLDHLSHALHTFSFFALVGMRDMPVRPVAAEDVVRVLQSALIDDRLSQKTVAVTGPEEMMLSEAVKRVADVVNRRPFMFRLPLFFHYLLARFFERAMTIPLVSSAQVRILSEGIVEPLPACDHLPEDLAPRIRFTHQQIQKGLPDQKRFGLKDCRCFASVWN